MTAPTRILDRLEQILFLAAAAWFFSRIWPRDLEFGSFNALLLVFSEGAVIIFVLLRKPTPNISIKLSDWAIAVLATIGPLFVEWQKHPVHPVVYQVGIAIFTIGMLTHVGAKLSLNFSFGIVAANRGVQRKGLYQLIRHPMYAGYMIAHTGYFITAPTLRNFLVYAFVWPLFIARIFAEERILGQDEAYQALKTKVPYRLIPGVF